MHIQCGFCTTPAHRIKMSSCINITLFISQKNQKNITVKFDYNYNENSREIAKEMIVELKLPDTYLNAIHNAIHRAKVAGKLLQKHDNI